MESRHPAMMTMRFEAIIAVDGARAAEFRAELAGAIRDRKSVVRQPPAGNSLREV